MAPSDDLSAELTVELLAEISRPRSTRDSIAKMYRRGVMQCVHGGAVDWAAVNGAILARYSPSGLNYIKRLAWAGAVVIA